MSNERQEQPTEARLRQYQSLLAVSETIATQPDLSSLFKHLAEQLRSVVAFDLVATVLYDPVRDLMCMQMRESALLENVPLPPGLPIAASPSGWAMQAQQPLVIPDIEGEERFPELTRLARQSGMRSYCYLPLTAAGRRLGALGFGRVNPSAFDEADLEFLQQVANQVAVAVDNAIHLERARAAEAENQRRVEQLRMLLEVGRSIVSHLNLRELIGVISEALQQVIDCDGVWMTLYEADSGQLRVFAVDPIFRATAPADEGQLVPLEGTPSAHVMKTRQPLIFTRAMMENSSSPAARSIAAGGMESGCIAPLLSQGRAIGTIAMLSQRVGAFSPEDAEMFTQIAGQIAIAVDNALAYREIETLKNKLSEEKLYLEEEINTAYNFEEIIGSSPALKRILKQVATVAPTDATVLIVGETGTGKELIARAIHNLSTRRDRTLVKLNCAAIPSGLLESELFGHERGAFTGAIAQRIGRFELANKGTLFLDEVGEIPLDLQPKLLRVLQEQEFERLGNARTQKVDVRLIAATNRDLAAMSAENKFRSDLYYRLNVFPVTIPPLRERHEDIPQLVRFFANKFALRMRKQIKTIPAETVAVLQHYHWPGNIRELENMIERAVILTQGTELQIPLPEIPAPVKPAVAPSAPALAPSSPSSTAGDAASLEAIEREHILRILRETKWVVGGPTGAAARLGMKRTTLQNRMAKLGIARPS